MKRKSLHRGKRKFLKRLFSAILIITLLSTGVYTDVSDVSADQGNVNSNIVSDNGIPVSPDSMSEYDATPYSDSAYEGDDTSSDWDDQYFMAGEEEDVFNNAVTYSNGDVQYFAADDAKDIFDNTTITLNNLTLQASYKDDSGQSQMVDLAQNGKYELPYNADINMKLEFVLGNYTAIDAGRPYVYKIPEGIRVDVEADHELADNSGKSIGQVHISRDGTLTFVFKDNIISKNVPFYVQFEGGLSEENREAGKNIDFKFPTASGSYDFSVVTTGKTKEEEKTEPGAVTMDKSGSRVVNVNGQNYIEWTVALGANGRDYITGTIHDNLPEGLTYAKIDGYPRVSGLSWGNNGKVTTNAKDGDKSITIDVVDCKPDYRANVTFCTYYDEKIFGQIITADTSADIINKASFEPEDDSEWSEDEGKVTVKPDMLSKSGTPIDANGDITWTVVINRENLNIKQLDYTDTIGSGQELTGDINVSPGLAGGSTLNKNANGFVINFSGADDTNTYTLTYKTHVTDFGQRSFKNDGELKGNNGVEYDVEQEATVPGLTLIQKNLQNYNSITNRFTWQIVVNPENRKMNNVVVTDTFDPSLMTFVSASGATANQKEPGKIEFNLGDITTTKTITVVTKINPDNFNENDWIGFKNHSEVISSLNDEPVSADAERYIQVTKPNLMDKSGQIKNDGTVEWTVTVYKSQLKTESLTLKDIIPEGMEYVPGTFMLEKRYYDPNPIYTEPTIVDGGKQQTISYTLKPSELKLCENNDGFNIKYKTKVTDLANADESNEYTNHAEISVDYEGDITVKDDDESTVEGVVGGVLDKSYAYSGSSRNVEWTVTINEARNDMSDIKNPKIYDELADYFDYVGGKLYKLDAKGNRTEVPASQYAVTVVNRQLIVQLPEIVNECYQFVFTTKFNCLSAQELEGIRITNTVVFQGDGVSFVKESGSIDNVNFSSSSAGAVTRTEIRVKKVDSVTKAPLEGARFELLMDGEVIGEATSGEDGYAVFKAYSSLLGYTLNLQEVQAPDGYIISESEWQIDQTNLKTDANGIRYYELVAENTRMENEGKICVRKVNESGDILQGARIGLYSDAACTQQLDTRITDASGTAVFSGRPEGTYYLKEITPPPGYKLSNPNNAVRVVIARAADGSIQVTYDGLNVDAHEMTNTRALGSLRIKKVEQGSTTAIPGASFAIYNDSACTDRVAYGTTGADGVVTLSGLELGKIYYYRETAAPGGYVLDNAIRSITVGKGTENADQTKEITVENELATGNIVITKTDDSTPAKTLSGVEFTLYDKDGINVVRGPVTTDSKGVAVFKDVPFGNYVIKESAGKTGYALAADKNITVKQVGNTEVTMVNKVIKCDINILKVDSDTTEPLAGARFGLYTKATGRQMAVGVTNADGKLVFRDIPYGDYVLKELEAPEGYNKDSDKSEFEISSSTIQSSFNGTGVINCTLENTKEKGNIRVLKLDEASQPLEGAEFTLYDENMIFVARVKSQDNGYVEFTDLRYGTYYVRETKAPDGYIRNTDTYKVIVDSDDWQNQYITDEGEKDLEVINRSSNAPYISVKLKKIDSKTGEAVANATFAMYATENGETKEIGSAVTDGDGIAYFKRIHVEKDDDNTIYFIKETSAPAGYHDPDAENEIPLGDGREEMNKYADPLSEDPDAPHLTDDEILWVGGSNPTGEEIVENDPIRGSIVITKTAIAEGNPPLAGVEYTLYQEVNGKKEKVNIEGVTNPVKTNKDGWAIFDDLPCGVYFVRETGVPKGYTLSSEETRFVIVDETPKPVAYKDKPIEVWVSKQAVGGSAEIPGATFKIVAQDNPSKTVDSWTSTSKPHYVLKDTLEIGKTYILSETGAPKGYGYALNAEFTVNSDGSISVTGAEKKGQTIIMRDRPINMKISKEGEDNPGTELPNATLAILDASGKEIHRFTTNGVASYDVPMGILTAPQTGYNEYTLREISAPDGYVLADDIKFSVGADGSIYKVTDTGREFLADEVPLTMIDFKRGSIYLRKLDASTRLDVPGAEIQIYNESGDPMLPTADDKEGLITSGRPLDIGKYLNPGTYTIRELNAPEGYLVAKPVKFEYSLSDGIKILEGSANNLNADKDTFMIYDKPIELKIRKQDTFGLILNGAELKLSEYNEETQSVGKEIVTFKSDGQKAYTVSPSVLSGGRYYILQELDAPDGYMRAEDIVFYMAADGVITRNDGVGVFNNTIVMEDDEAGLGIGKFDLDDENDCLAGCTLKLEAQDDRWWNPTTWVSDGHVRTWGLEEFTPGCTYILTEVEAPVGYAYTDPIIFTIDKDDHQVYYIINGERDVKAENKTVRISDGKIKLTVSKQDFYDHTEVPGAEFSILDKEGNVLASWVSGSEPCAVDTSKLIASSDSYEEYILREVKAPNGYNKAADIPFAIDRDGNIYLVQGDGQYTLAENNMLTMYDDPMLTVSKLDTAGNPVVGAKLTVTAKEDPNFKPISWETTAERHTFEDGAITPGVTYILTETEAPDGYGYGQSLEFMVDADNNVFVNGQKVDNRRVVMLDKLITVNVSKLDGDSTKHLAGAKLVIKNQAGAVIHTFTSTSEAILIPKEIFKAVPGGMSYYTLSEVEAPKGYLKAQDIAFAINGSGNLLQKKEDGTYAVCENNTLIMRDYAVGNAPKTGDGTPLGMLRTLCLTGFLGTCTIFGLYFKRRRKRAKA